MILQNRRYRFWSFLSIPLRVTPVLTGVKLLSQILGSLLPSVQVLLTASFVDTVTAIFGGTMPYTAVFLPLGLLMALVAYQYLSGSLVQFANTRFQIGLTEAFGGAVLEKRARLEYRHIEDNDTWDLITRTCKEPASRIWGGYDNLLGLAGGAVQIVSVLLVLMVQVWWAGLVIVGFSVPLMWIAIRGGKKEYAANQEAEKLRRRATYLQTVLTGRENVEERALFGYTDRLNGIWQDRADTARCIELKATARNFINRKGTGILVVMISLLIAMVLLFPLRDGLLTLGMFIGLVTAVFGLIQGMSWGLPWMASELARNTAYLKDLTAFSVLSEQEGAVDLPSAKQACAFERLEFRHVAFAYPNTDRTILRDFSLTLEAGRHYAFVGVNGAGKTTLTKLLVGLYDNYEGEILLNGRELRSYTLAERKAFFAVVYQDFAKYFVTLRDNLALGDTQGGVPEETLLQTVNVIGLQEAVERLPDGLDTPLGKIREGGVDLSGGEWQRVAIARAMVSPAQLTLLDEPTAALDPVAESKVYELFGRISAGKSTVFITHRLGAARLADEIVVLDQGRVAEQGSHQTLMEAGGLYAEMFESQRSWYQ